MPSDSPAVSSSNPPSDKHFRRNYILGMFNAACFGFVDSASSPYLVMSLFINTLSGSNLLVGLLPAISNGGWYLPQFLISHRLQQLPRKLVVYRIAALVRVLCWTMLVVSTLLLANNPALLLILFFVFFTTSSLAAGISGTPFMDIVAKTIPMGRRGRYFGNRDLLGALSAIGAGYLVNYFLNPNLAPEFPINFGFIFLAAGIGVTLGVGAFSLVIEPVEKTMPQQHTFSEQIRAARNVLQDDHVYRRFLLTRIMLAIADLATPFYSIYAVNVLQVSPETVGTYIGISTIASLTTNPLWSRLSDRRGNRIVLLGASTGIVIIPLIALVFGLLSPSPELGLPFGVLFILLGMSRTSANIAMPSYLLDHAPADRRPLYISFTNTILGIATLVPVFGGILLDLAGFRVLLIVTLVIAAIAWWLAQGLVEPREIKRAED